MTGVKMAQVLLDFGVDDLDGTVINEKIAHMASHENLRVIRGFAPLSKMFGYATTLRSITQGHGTYTMEPIDYREVDKDEVKRIFEGF